MHSSEHFHRNCSVEKTDSWRQPRFISACCARRTDGSTLRHPGCPAKEKHRMKLEIQLDRESGVPLTEQIVTGITAWIRSRTAHPGSKLPSIRQFAADYGVSRFPVIEAYDRLVSLGYVDSRHGSGFYVAERPRGALAGDGTSAPRRGS